MPFPDATVIVPCRHEEDNVGPLIKRLDQALSGSGSQVIVVDDSDDDRTARAVRAAAADLGPDRLDVSVYHRRGADRHGGLAGAVIDGLRRARFDRVVVMDGDLQHPPELVPVLLKALASGNDIVMASRHCAGGSDDGLDGGYRRVVSWGCTWLAKALFPVVLRGATDPMTGFFALRLDSISPDDLRARGFKILLDILVRNPRLRRTEVPLRFGKRHSGASKGDSRQGLEYLRQLPRLRATATFARQANRPRRDAVTETATVIS